MVVLYLLFDLSFWLDLGCVRGGVGGWEFCFVVGISCSGCGWIMLLGSFVVFGGVLVDFEYWYDRFCIVCFFICFVVEVLLCSEGFWICYICFCFDVYIFDDYNIMLIMKYMIIK